MLMHDEITGSPFIACYGGMLKASDADMSPDIILSTNQMSDSWLDTAARDGARAHLADRLSAHFEIAGGRRVRTHRRNGHPGIFCQPITPADPTWDQCPRVWISKDEVYYPKDVSNGLVISKMTCSTSDNFLPTPVDDPIDNKALAKAVDKSLATSGLEMGEFQHLKPLDLDSPAQERTLEARLGGHHIAKVKFTLENAHGGSKVLSAKGKRRIAEWTKTKYRHPGTRFRSMKTKRRAKIDRVLAQQKKSSSTLIIKPGDSLSMDIYMSGIPHTPYFHVITDTVVDLAWVYGLQSKADGDVNLEEHIRNFYKPFTTCGDAAGEHLGGEMDALMRKEFIQFRASTPGKQFMHGGEQFILRLTNVTTYLLLDSQAPTRCTLRAAQHACHILASMAFEMAGRITTPHREIFGVDLDLRVFKRWGCLVYIRIDKSEREKFGAHGLFGVLMGLHAYTFEDWTYEVLVFRTKSTRFTRDLVSMEDVMPFLHGREMLQRQQSTTSESPFLRRTIGHLTPSILARTQDDKSKSGIVTPACISPGWSDASFVHAASNMARDPISWMPLNDSAASPILKGDTVITPNADTTVVAVSKNDIVVQIDGTSERFHLSPLQSFFQDDMGLVHRDKPLRKRNRRVLYNATHLGGTPTARPVHTYNAVDDGADLVGTSFWATVSPKAEKPSHYIITDVGNPETHAELYNGRPPPHLKFVRSDELDDPNIDLKDVKRDSTVKEIRQWVAESKTDPTTETLMYMLGLEKLPPIEMESPTPLKILKTNAIASTMGNGGHPSDGAVSNGGRPPSGTAPRTVRFATEVTHHECPSSYYDTFDSRDFISPQQKNGRTIRGDATDHPWPSAGDPNTKKSLRKRLRDARVARRKKKIPRRVVLSVLKGKFRPCHLKYSIDVPGAYRFAHAKSKGTDYSDMWRKEESEEIGYLTGLDAFIKGLKLEDLPEGVTKDQVLGTLWAHDAKPKPRARLVADGSQEDTTGVDTFSPVLKLENVKVVLAAIAQERMDFRMIDIKKAFFKGRLHQACHIWAPEGFASFPGEIWSVQLPIYGLSISSRLFLSVHQRVL